MDLGGDDRCLLSSGSLGGSHRIDPRTGFPRRGRVARHVNSVELMVNRGTGAARTGTGVSSAAPGDRETVCQVRHPRYLQLLLALLGGSLLAYPLAAYRACALWIPGAWGIVRLEAKELRKRYGRECEDYCR